MPAIAELLLAWAGLMALLAATVAASFVFTGTASLAVSLSIATAKAMLVFWVFMRLKRESGLIRLAALAGWVWLALLFILSFGDFATRS